MLLSTLTAVVLAFQATTAPAKVPTELPPGEPPATRPTTGGVVPAPVADDDVGTAVYAGNEFLRNYYPTPTLVTKITKVPRSKFPCVDVHCHWSVQQNPDDLLKAMDERNVVYANNLSGGFGPNLDAILAKFPPDKYPRLLTFCNIDWDQVGTPTWDSDVRQYLIDCKKRGVRGLKIFKGLGLTDRDANGEVIRIDDPRLNVVWDTCAEIGFPILQHAADPIAFFEPIDEHNERWMQLKRHPDWSFFGPSFPKREEVLAEFDHVVASHPKTTWIAAHLGNYAEDLASLGERLDKYPNLNADISAREAEWGRQPYTARRFFVKYQDRLLFGTDRYPGRPDQPRYRVYFRILESDDEYFDYYEGGFPPTGEWKVYGLFLPDAVLKKIYYDNAARILKLPPARQPAVP